MQSLTLRWEWCGSITFFCSKGGTQEGGEQNDRGGALQGINTGRSHPQSSEFQRGGTETEGRILWGLFGIEVDFEHFQIC